MSTTQKQNSDCTIDDPLLELDEALAALSREVGDSKPEEGNGEEKEDEELREEEPSRALRPPSPAWMSGVRLYHDEPFNRSRMPRSPHWSVVWSDLMMTMFIFFAVLYLYQSAHKEIIFGEVRDIKFVPDVGSGLLRSAGKSLDPFDRDEEPGLTRLYDVSRKTVSAEKLDDFAKVDLAPGRTVRIILTGDLLFDSGSAELKGDALESLAKIAPLVSQSPYMINVVGHTDDVPIHTAAFPSNWELSLVRASRVARFLMEKTAIPQERFAVTGHASFAPVAANDSETNKAANRRVEIVLTREKPGTVPSEER